MKSFRHYVATAVYFGKNVVRDNKDLFRTYGKRAFIVTDEFLGAVRISRLRMSSPCWRSTASPTQ